MTKATPNRAAPRILSWIGWAGLDAVGRLVLLTGGTAALSRLLSPRDFGVTALALTFVAVAAVFVGTPFEEALAQRRALRMTQLRSALGASWLIGLAVLGLSAGLGFALARAYGEPDMRLLLPAATLSVFFTGHTVILTALARRLRRFNDVAIASLAGHAVGVALSLVVAWLGGGLWALIANRLFIVVAIAVILQWRVGFLVTPRWSFRPIGELGRFAGVTFLDRLIDNTTYLVFNNVVEAFYGSNVLGFVNMAMRIIEPIRGAVAATGHNLAFSFFAPASRDPARLGALAASVVSQSALTITPIFAGLAAVTPTLLPLMAGPGWDEAIGIAICLAVGCAIVSPPRLIFTALTASAEPEYALVSTIVSFAAMMAALVGFSALGPISVGLARVVGDATRAAIAIVLASRRLSWSRLGRLDAVLPAWLLSAAMGLAVTILSNLLPQGHRLPQLLALVAFGVAVYGLLLATFARPALASLRKLVRPHAAALATS